MNKKSYSVFFGTSGVIVPVTQSHYPPEYQGKSRLSYYSSLFNSVEINSSFYKNPRPSTVSKWAESVPDGFQFTFKIPKAITHAKALNFNSSELCEFMAVVDHAAKKKGCLLVQFPPALNVQALPQLEDLLKELNECDQAGEWKVAIEFRNKSWYDPEVFKVVSKYKAAVVIHDLPGSAPPHDFKSPFKYVRFHGPEGRYRGSYGDDFLYEYARYIKQWSAAGPVYVYFNNTMGNAVGNLKKLREMVE